MILRVFDIDAASTQVQQGFGQIAPCTIAKIFSHCIRVVKTRVIRPSYIIDLELKFVFFIDMAECSEDLGAQLKAFTIDCSRVVEEESIGLDPDLGREAEECEDCSCGFAIYCCPAVCRYGFEAHYRKLAINFLRLKRKIGGWCINCVL